MHWLPSLKRQYFNAMERRRAVMIDTSTGQPVDPNWQPLLQCDELDPANDLMASNRLHFRWQWLPVVACLHGAAACGST